MLPPFPYPHPQGPAAEGQGLIEPPDPRIGRVVVGLSRISRVPVMRDPVVPMVVAAGLGLVAGYVVDLVIESQVRVPFEWQVPLMIGLCAVLVVAGAAGAWRVVSLLPEVLRGDNLFLGEHGFQVVKRNDEKREGALWLFEEPVLAAHGRTRITMRGQGSQSVFDRDLFTWTDFEGRILFSLSSLALADAPHADAPFGHAVIQAFARAQLPGWAAALERGETRRIPLLRFVGSGLEAAVTSGGNGYVQLGPVVEVVVDGRKQLSAPRAEVTCVLEDGKCVLTARSGARCALRMEETPQAQLLATLFRPRA